MKYEKNLTLEQKKEFLKPQRLYFINKKGDIIVHLIGHSNVHLNENGTLFFYGDLADWFCDKYDVFTTLDEAKKQKLIYEIESLESQNSNEIQDIMEMVGKISEANKRINDRKSQIEGLRKEIEEISK